MTNAAQLHNHHRFGSMGCFGYRLEAGDVLQATDKYSSTDGTWQACPCPGVTLGNVEVIWVRPV